MLDELVSVCEIKLPEPALAPVIVPGAFTVQVYVVPGSIVDERAIEVLVSLQIICDAGVAVTTGSGLTFKTEFIDFVQPLAPVPVAVYVVVVAGNALTCAPVLTFKFVAGTQEYETLEPLTEIVAVSSSQIV